MEHQSSVEVDSVATNAEKNSPGGENRVSKSNFKAEKSIYLFFVLVAFLKSFFIFPVTTSVIQWTKVVALAKFLKPEKLFSFHYVCYILCSLSIYGKKSKNYATGSFRGSGVLN